MKRHQWSALVLALAAVLVGPACGSYHTTAELEAANVKGSGTSAGESHAANEADASTPTDPVGTDSAPAAIKVGAAQGPGAGSEATQGTRPGRAAPVPGAGSEATQGPKPGGAAPVPGAGSEATQGPKPGGAAPVPGPGGAASRGTEAPIKIGEVGVYSGVAGSIFAPQSQAVRSYVNHLNAQGGINGHPVMLAVIDDGGDPARHRSAVQQLINDGVVAFVGNAETLTGRSSIDLLEKHRVPVIGGDTGSPHYYDSAMYFPEASEPNPKWYADLATSAAYAKEHGITKIAVLTCTEAQACRDGDGVFTSRAADFGLQVVSRSRVSIAQPDFTAECLAARNAGAELLLNLVDAPSISRLAQSCARIGFRPPLGLATSSPAVATDPNVSAAIFGSGVFPWVLSDTPARAEYHDVFSTIPNARFDNLSAGGWAAASIFAKAAKATIGPKDTPSSALVLAGLWGLAGETMGGLTAPLPFRKDQPPAKTSCYFPMVTSGGNWQALNAGHYECVPF